MTTFSTVPTTAQTQYFCDLLKKRAVAPEVRERGLQKVDSMTRQQLSVAIEWVKAQPPLTKIITGEGFYVGTDEGIYSWLYNTRQKRRVWKRFVSLPGGKWKYVRVSAGVARVNIEPDGHKMTEDEALAFGKAHGYCVVCGRTLTDPESVEKGIGPVCASKTIWG